MPKPFRPRCARRLALLALLLAAGAVQAQESDWTILDPPPRPSARPSVRGFDLDLVFSQLPINEIKRAGVTVSVEGSPLEENADDDVVVARRGLSPQAGGLYYGAGLGFDDFGGGLAAGRLVAGAAAPLADGAMLYGEYQHLRSLPGGAADDRIIFGLRNGF